LGFEHPAYLLHQQSTVQHNQWSDQHRIRLLGLSLAHSVPVEHSPSDQAKNRSYVHVCYRMWVGVTTSYSIAYIYVADQRHFRHTADQTSQSLHCGDRKNLHYSRHISRLRLHLYVLFLPSLGVKKLSLADYSAVLWIISGVETNVGIIFSCMHAARPILSKLLPNYFGEVNRASSKNEKLKTIEISSNWSTSSWKSTPSNSSFTAGLDAGRTKSSLDWNAVVLQKPMAVRSGTPRIADQFGLNMSERPPARIMYSHSVKIDEWL
jgi:hypothetical protein